MYHQGRHQHSPPRSGGSGGVGYSRHRGHAYGRPDGRDGDYRRSRKDSPSPSRGGLNYDDNDGDARDDFRDDYRDDHRDSYRDRDNYRKKYRGRSGDRGWRDDYEDGRASRGREDMSRQREEGELGHDTRASYGGGGGDYDSGRFRARRSDHRERGRVTPGKAVVLDGLPRHATKSDVFCGIGYVTRDPDRVNDLVKFVEFRFDQDGYPIVMVEFHRRSDAQDFFDQYKPGISFPLEDSRGPDSEPVNVSLSLYSDDSDAPRDLRQDGNDWHCSACGGQNYSHRTFCYKCKAERRAAGPLLTGETDECPRQMPSQYLVIRDLDQSVNEVILSHGVMKLFVDSTSEVAKQGAPTTNKLKSTAPSASRAGLGAKPGTLRRVFLMRDRRTNESWRYGFAEFATIEDAMAAVTKFRATPGFTIASKPVVVAFIHTGVFIPPFDAATAENPEFTFAPIYNPAIRVKYWDDRAYPSVHVVVADPVSDPQSPENAENSGGNGNGEAAKNEGSRPKKAKKEPSVAVKIAMMPQMQIWAKKSAEIHRMQARVNSEEVPSGGKPLSSVQAAASGDLEETQEDGRAKPHWTDEYTSYADWDRYMCLVCDWEASVEEVSSSAVARKALVIDHEVHVHNRYGDASAREKAAAALATLQKEPVVITRRVVPPRNAPLPIYKSYADFDALTCLLCRRVFKHKETIWRHEQQSQLHKDMLQDPERKKSAEEELKSRGKSCHIMVPSKEYVELQKQRMAQYRDRAKERRQVFGSSTKSSGQPSKAVSQKRKDPVAPTPDETPAKKSKGAGMLAKMGWTAGAGLGAEGSGRTQAIAADAYAPGVGLGAQGGRLGDASEEAARKTKNNFSDFVDKTREKARERYERM